MAKDSAEDEGTQEQSLMSAGTLNKAINALADGGVMKPKLRRRVESLVAKRLAEIRTADMLLIEDTKRKKNLTSSVD